MQKWKVVVLVVFLARLFPSLSLCNKLHTFRVASIFSCNFHQKNIYSLVISSSQLVVKLLLIIGLLKVKAPSSLCKLQVILSTPSHVAKLMRRTVALISLSDCFHLSSLLLSWFRSPPESSLCYPDQKHDTEELNKHFHHHKSQYE